MNKNEEFIQNVTMDDIPWDRITTAYGMATELPEYLKVLQAMNPHDSVQNAFREITYSIEHQGSLWHSTPFALIFLVRIYHDVEKQKENNKTAAWLVEELEKFFALMIECHCDLEELGGDDPLPLFSDMISEKYLWPAGMDEEEEDEWWEEGYSDELFVSIWHYSYEVVKEFDTRQL